MTFEIFFTEPYFRRILIVALLVGWTGAAIGVFLVLRNLSLLGDGLGHVSFGGVAVGLVVGATMEAGWFGDTLPLLLALLFSILAALAIHFLRAKRIVSGDTAIGIFFTGALALGLVVLAFGEGISTTVEGYLFGNLLLVTETDLYLVLGMAVLIFGTLTYWFRDFFAITFDEEAARAQGLPVLQLNLWFTILTAAAIVIVARIVGVLLISALLIVPAAVALQFSNGFRRSIFLAQGYATLAILVGLFVAAELDLGSGASIALVATLGFALALALRWVLDKAGVEARL